MAGLGAGVAGLEAGVAGLEAGVVGLGKDLGRGDWNWGRSNWTWGPGAGAVVTGRGARTGLGAVEQKPDASHEAASGRETRNLLDRKLIKSRLASSLEDVRKIVSETQGPWPPSSAPGRGLSV